MFLIFEIFDDSDFDHNFMEIWSKISENVSVSGGIFEDFRGFSEIFMTFVASKNRLHENKAAK